MEHRFFRNDSFRIAYYLIAYTLYTAIAGSFDVAFTLRMTGSFVALTRLYLFYYSCLAASFVCATFLVSSGKFSRGFRFNLFFQFCIGMLMYLFMPNKEHSLMLVPYFALKGVSEGFFWSTRHASITCLTKNEGRDRFLLSLQVGTVFVSVVMPLIAGIFMHFNSVKAGFSGVYLGAALAALLSLLLGPVIVSTAPPRPELRRFKTFLFSRENKPWRRYIFFSAINGSLALVCAGVLNVSVLKTEFNIGIFTSGAALLSAVFLITVRKRLKGKNTRRIVWVVRGATGDFVGRLVYTIFLSIPSLIIKAFCDSFLSPLRSIFSENIIRKRSDLMAISEGYTVLEPFLFQEIFILFARIIGFSLCTLVFTLFPVNAFLAARIILCILAFAPFLDLFLLSRIEKETCAK